MGIWKDEMRYKAGLCQRGKGNRRNRRFVSLAAGDFEKVSYFDASHGIPGADRHTSITEVVTPTSEEVESARLSQIKAEKLPSYSPPAPRFATLRMVNGKLQ